MSKQCIFINDKGEAAIVMIPSHELPTLEQIKSGFDPLPFCNNILKIENKTTSKIYCLLSSTKGGISKIKVPSVQWIKMPYHSRQFPDVIMIATRPKSWTIKHIVDIAVRKEKVKQPENNLGVKLHPERTISTINHCATFINKRHTIFGTCIIYDPHADFTLDRFKRLYQSSFKYNKYTLAISLLVVFYSAKMEVDNFEEICNKYLHIDTINKSQVTSIEEFVANMKEYFDSSLIDMSLLLKYKKEIDQYLQSNPRLSHRGLLHYIMKLYVPEAKVDNRIEMCADNVPRTEDARRQLLNEFIDKAVKEYLITFEDLFIMLQPMIDRIYVRNNNHYYNAFVSSPIREREMLFVSFNQGSNKNTSPYTWDKPPRPIIGEDERKEIEKIMKEQCKYAGEEYIDPFID